MFKPIISSDSHVCEPPGTFVDRIDKKYLDVAPRVVRDPDRASDLLRDLGGIEGVERVVLDLEEASEGEG